MSFTANYTYAKSIGTASSGGDKAILSAVNGQVGGTRASDRSVSPTFHT